MSQTVALARPTLTTQVVGGAIAVAASVVLPQVAHQAGLAAGVGTAVGVTWLPMHLPVILAGFLLGWRVGLATGLAAPLISFALTGMPPVPVLVSMVPELAVYGAVAGLLAGVRPARGRPVDLALIAGKLLVVQLAGRLAAAAAIFVAAAFFAGKTAPAAVVGSTLAGLPGLVTQWVAVPLVIWSVARAQASRERR